MKSSASKNSSRGKVKASPARSLNKQPIPIVNLSSVELSAEEERLLAYGLDHSFIDKHLHVKKNVAASFETVADRITPYVENDSKEHFHEFLRANVDIFSKNVYSSSDDTYKKLLKLVKNKDIAVIPGDKDSSIVIMDRVDYNDKLQLMIDEGILKGIYAPTTDETLSDLNKFNSFVYRYFRNCDNYDNMRATSNQPAQLYGTAKTHKFMDNSEITVGSLKFRPIISQVGTYTHSASQVIAEYLKPLVSDNLFLINSTQEFGDIIKDQPPLSPNEEYVSYDVESLFTNVPVPETIEYILDEIYIRNKLPQLCERKFFKKFLIKLTCECTFMFNNLFFKQLNGCTMGGPLSVVLSNIFMTMLEMNIVLPMKPLFYKRYVDDIITRRDKNKRDLLLEQLQSYHPNINFTVEVSPIKFLDTHILLDDNGSCQTKVYRKPNKYPVHWSSKIPLRYKRNAIIGDLYRSKRISSCFDKEVEEIKEKFRTADFPERFVNSVVKNFIEPDHALSSDLPLIPPYFFDSPNLFVLIDVPFCQENKRLSKHFLHKFKSFVNVDCTVVIRWITKKVRHLFNLKSRNPHQACKIYEGQCSCGQTYIGETKRNLELRWKEHNDPRKSSEPAKHLFHHPTHSFTWKVIMNAPQNTRIRKNLEASLIAWKAPVLNNQVDSKKLILFRHGVT